MRAGVAASASTTSARRLPAALQRAPTSTRTCARTSRSRAALNAAAATTATLARSILCRTARSALAPASAAAATATLARTSAAPAPKNSSKGGGKMASASKLKLLCLHGYTQNASSFSSRIGSMRKGLKSRVEFVFVDGPFESTGLPGAEVNEAQGLETGGRSWWTWKDVGPAARPSLAAQYTGWEQTQQVLVEAIKEHQPDGLLGFSQGATAAALMLSHLGDPEVQQQLAGLPLPRFAILVAGFVPRDPSYAAVMQERHVAVPTLVVHGEKDTLVPWERTEALLQCLGQAQVLRHEGAHLVPTCTGAFKQAVVEFLESVPRGAAAGAAAANGQHQQGASEA